LAGTPVEDMNADIIFILCPYLELGSLSCLAAAYPQWSAIIHRHLKKKYNKTFLKLEFGMDNEKWWRAEKPFDSPKHSVKVDSYAILAQVTTSCLLLELRKRQVARRVLQTITLTPGSRLELYVKSKRLDKEAILLRSQLVTLKNLVYKGEMEMLSLDVLALLDSDHTSLHVKHDLGVTQSVDSRQLECWLVKLVEKYLDAQAGKVQCVRRSPQHYELKRIPSGRRTRGRSIYVYKRALNTPLVHKSIGVSILVRNL
uniref:Ubiquitin-like domain-containing protein n=1 Tax=Heligmosomoides polygyrus TaxID=6339 RepID=A0A183G4R0_HELPZ